MAVLDATGAVGSEFLEQLVESKKLLTEPFVAGKRKTQHRLQGDLILLTTNPDPNPSPDHNPNPDPNPNPNPNPNLNPNSNPDQIKARNEKLRGGRCLNGSFESPPCVHMNVKVHGWVFEVSKLVHEQVS